MSCPVCFFRGRIRLIAKQPLRAVKPKASALVSWERCKSQASNSVGNESSIGEIK
jgi:hypothetical protein